MVSRKTKEMGARLFTHHLSKLTVFPAVLLYPPPPQGLASTQPAIGSQPQVATTYLSISSHLVGIEVVPSFAAHGCAHLFFSASMFRLVFRETSSRTCTPPLSIFKFITATVLFLSPSQLVEVERQRWEFFLLN